MKISKRIGLGLVAVVIATLPFCIRATKSKPQEEELVDILCRDSYEQVRDYCVGVKGYTLSTRDVVVIGYSEEDLKNSDGFANEFTEEGVMFEGLNLRDPTPEVIAGQRVLGCRIVDPDNPSFRDFSNEELGELEQIARENIKYRAIEREIYDDVDKNGVIITSDEEPVIDVPVLKDLWTREIPTTKRMEYKIDEELAIKVYINVVEGKVDLYKLVFKGEWTHNSFMGGPLGVFYTYYSPDDENKFHDKISKTWLDRVIQIIRGE